MPSPARSLPFEYAIGTKIEGGREGREEKVVTALQPNKRGGGQKKDEGKEKRWEQKFAMKQIESSTHLLIKKNLFFAGSRHKLILFSPHPSETRVGLAIAPDPRVVLPVVLGA